MDLLMLSYEVGDYQRWQEVFLAKRGMRQAAGLEAQAVFRDHAAPNQLAVFLRTTEPARAMAFVRSPELRAAMKEGGIQGPPRAHFLEEVTAEPLEKAIREGTDTYVFVIHRVRDYEEWKPHYDRHQATRQAAELSDVGLWRDMLDPNQVAILFRAGDLAKARTFVTSEDLIRVMQEAGVEGPPEIRFLDAQTLAEKRARPQPEHRPRA